MKIKIMKEIDELIAEIVNTKDYENIGDILSYGDLGKNIQALIELLK